MTKKLTGNDRRKFLKALTGLGAGLFLSKLIPKAAAYDRPSHHATEIKGKFEDISFNPKSADPTDEEGKIYYNDTDKKLKIHNGTEWKNIGPGGGGSGFSPVGSVMAWLKSYPNTPALPDGWVECSGQVLIDTDSPYNGQIIPDLNGGNRFLRGSATSGGIGGSTTHTHTLSYPSSTATHFTTDTGRPIMRFNLGGLLWGSFLRETTSGGNSIPPYYDIIWIMKVK